MDYISDEFQHHVKTTRDGLPNSSDLEDIEVITEHMQNFGSAPLVLEVSVHGVPGDIEIVALDLAKAA